MANTVKLCLTTMVVHNAFDAKQSEKPQSKTL